MTVIVLSACPPGLRGHLTRWLLEISAGVFVGHLNPRVRDRLWGRIEEMAGAGRALMVYSARGEQRLDFRVHAHAWMPEDFEGITLVRRAVEGGDKVAERQGRDGWSVASRRRRFGGRPVK